MIFILKDLIKLILSIFAWLQLLFTFTFKKKRKQKKGIFTAIDEKLPKSPFPVKTKEFSYSVVFNSFFLPLPIHFLIKFLNQLL